MSKLATALSLLLACTEPRIGDARIGMTSTALTEGTFQAFVQESSNVLIDFYDRNSEGWPHQKGELEAALRQVRDYGSKVAIGTVDVVTQQGLAEKYVKHRKLPQLMWFTHGEPTQYHRSLRNAKSMADFVMALDRDPVASVQDEAEAKTSYNRAVFAKVKKGSTLYKSLEVVAAKHMDTTAFTYLESGDNTVEWLEDTRSEPEMYTGSHDVGSLETWVKEFLIKSEPVPEGHPVYSDGSLVVVGKTFEETVSKQDKDVFMLVYAPWCGFSRKFFPVWTAFAKAVADVKHLVVAKMDGDQNTSPLPEDFAWSSYPHIFFVKAGTKKPIEFHENRTVASLVQFATEHSSQPVVLDPSVSLEDLNEL